MKFFRQLQSIFVRKLLLRSMMYMQDTLTLAHKILQKKNLYLASHGSLFIIERYFFPIYHWVWFFPNIAPPLDVALSIVNCKEKRSFLPCFTCRCSTTNTLTVIFYCIDFLTHHFFYIEHLLTLVFLDHEYFLAVQLFIDYL